jgi:hypothetical protein
LQCEKAHGKAWFAWLDLCHVRTRQKEIFFVYAIKSTGQSTRHMTKPVFSTVGHKIFCGKDNITLKTLMRMYIKVEISFHMCFGV